MRKAGMIVVIVMMAALLHACASSSGVEMTQDKVKQIVIGQTTTDDMTRLFGPPAGQSYDSSGKMMMNWFYVNAQPGFMIPSVRAQSLSALFDEKGILEKYNITDNPEAGPRWGD